MTMIDCTLPVDGESSGAKISEETQGRQSILRQTSKGEEELPSTTDHAG